MNFKHFALILIILVLFSLSAVSAGNETAMDNATAVSDNATQTIIADNTTSMANTSGYNSDRPNIAYSNASNAQGNSLLQIALVTDEENPLESYIDISIGDGDNSADVNNKNYFYSFTQGSKASSPAASGGNSKLVDLVVFNRNNALFLNINLLNKGSQEVKLTTPNFIWDFINKLISAFFSLFN